MATAAVGSPAGARRALGTGTLVVGGPFALSGVLLALAEWMAARGDASAHFYVFWVGYALAVAPVAWLALRAGVTAARRSALVAGLGGWSLCPSLLRTGAHPLFFDEFTHLRMLQDLVRVGHPVSTTGLLQIGASFPGLELAASTLYHLSGLSLWLSAVGIAALAHVALLVGVLVLVRDATGGERAGVVAALVYSLNPSWLFFDAQFSYETLALPVLVWSIVLALRGARPPADGATRTVRATQVVAAGVLLGALVVIHHVSAVVACLVLIGVSVVATVSGPHPAHRTARVAPWVTWSLAAWAAVLTAWRFVEVGHPLVVYLGPTYHLSSELSQLLSILGIGSGLPLHAAFASSTVPGFEVVCAYAMLPVLLAVFVWAVWALIGRREDRSPLLYVATVLGALFFASLPLASAAAYAESVHRSWAFSFLGIAVVVGAASQLAMDGRVRLTVRSRRVWPPTASSGRLLRPVVVACAAVVAIGGVAVGTSTAYRFGAPAAPQTDPLYVGTQTDQVASWIARHATHGDVVFANRFAIRPIAVASDVGIANPAGPEALLVLSTAVPAAALRAFADDHVTYLVFDRRTGQVGGVRAWFWYVPSDRQLPSDARQSVYPGRVACLDWARAVFSTTDDEVLLVDRSRLLADVRDGTDGEAPGCAVGGPA